MLNPMWFSGRTCGVLASAMMIAVLGACSGGEGPDSDYCKDLGTARASVQEFRSGGADDMFDAFAITRKLAKEAPPDIKDDWAIIADIYADIEKAFKDAGIDTPQEFADISAGKQPEGVDQEKLHNLPAKVQRLDAPDAAKATKAIEQYATDVCKVKFQP